MEVAAELMTKEFERTKILNQLSEKRPSFTSFPRIYTPEFQI